MVRERKRGKDTLCIHGPHHKAQVDIVGSTSHHKAHIRRKDSLISGDTTKNPRSQKVVHNITPKELFSKGVRDDGCVA
jgi:hypothetical protein